jgi:hypothetical protein
MISLKEICPLFSNSLITRPWKPHRAKLIKGTHEPSQLGKEGKRTTNPANATMRKRAAGKIDTAT